MTPEQMREAAARVAETCDYPRAAPTEAEAACYDAMAERIAAAIPIPPAPDREALVALVAEAMQVENRPKHDCRNLDQREAEEADAFPAYKALARAALAALEAAGALR